MAFPRFRRWTALAAMMLALLVTGTLAPTRAAAQLISPGKLSAAHAQLEGVRNCTQCHRLGQRGVVAELCLACHTPLAERLQRDEGFHATLAEDDCASCHKDHFGADFGVVRLDTLKFDHERTGYGLTGLHGEASCRDCHTPALVADPGVRSFKSEHGALARTYLGLPDDCLSCHDADDPHEGQFEGQGCEECHDTGGWGEAAGFDHDLIRYRLTGRHRDVECTGCHEPLEGVPRPGTRRADGTLANGALRFTPLSFQSCRSCHEDPHGGSMPGGCESCHSTGGWASVDRGRIESTFDHGSTDFPLEGIHAGIDCASCHDPRAAGRLEGIRMRYVRGTESRTYPRPVAASCSSCHEDAHQGDFATRPDGGDCRGCHGQNVWLPAHYDLGRHLAEASFPLEGAHLATPCASCHRTAEGDLVIRLGSPDCEACHAPQDPHLDQFQGRGCRDCHDVEAFTIPDFDHDATRYTLDGAHARVSCDACHRSEPAEGGRSFIRYRPLGTECRDCHGGAS